METFHQTFLVNSLKNKIFDITCTAWKVSVFSVFLVHVFPHLDLIRTDTAYLSVFSPNAKKHGPEQLQIRTLLTQCKVYQRFWFLNYSLKVVDGRSPSTELHHISQFVPNVRSTFHGTENFPYIRQQILDIVPEELKKLSIKSPFKVLYKSNEKVESTKLPL